MKSIQEFLSYLSDLDIRLWLDSVSGAPPEEVRLRCNAPKEALTPDLQSELIERKVEIINFLQKANLASSSAFEQIKPVPREGNLPLSFGQQGLWFLDQFEGGSAAYNQLFAVRLSGLLNLTVLQQALTEIVRRHEVLRTTFKNVDGQPFQVIAPDPNFTMSVVDLLHLPETEQWTEVQQLAIAESQRPFNLAQDLLLRVALFQLGNSEYMLLFTIHHMISDAWSGGIIIQELAALYEAFSMGKPASLPELSIQYADFAHWERQRLHGAVFEEQLTYWKQQLDGALPILELPSDRPRPAVQTFRGATTTLEIGADVTQRLKKLSQQEGVTLFMTLLAAFKTLLYRYTNQQDICVGTAIVNRHSRDLESLIGYFVNTLVLRTDLSGNPTFRELLSQVRNVAWEAYNHQDLPFELLVAKLQPERNLSYTPLFQSMFVLENVPTETLKIPGLTLSFLEMPTATAKFDLSLGIRETEQGLLGKFEYNTDLFDAATITRMAGHFQTLLSAIVADREQRLCELPLLTEAERHQLLVEWNDTQTDYPQDKCIHQLFEAQVERTPDAQAVVFEDKQLTYRELNRRANQVAHHLRSLGVEPDDMVGLCVERSLEMVVGLLGILKAGGAYVPLDPAYPQERLELMLSDAQVSVLLTTEKLVAKLPEHRSHLVYLDTHWKTISQENEANLVSGVNSKNLAYVIYTSGSTGKPKGVMIQHQSLVSFTKTAIFEYGLTQQDRVLQFASLSFDVAAEEIYPCLSCGGTVVLRTDEMLNSVSEFLHKCREWQLTVLDLPTAYWHQLTSELASGNLVLPDSLRLVIFGGERSLPEMVQKWQKCVGDRPQLVNAYGPTEATVEATMYKFSGLVPKALLWREVPIGRPICNVQVYLLDEHLQLVPIGIPGELHIGGAGLARGYLNRSELTAEKFIPNPFSDEDSELLYKTGDLVRYLTDGTLEYIGRIDNQVKIRGFRIELGEVEAVLSQHPDVREIAVILREDYPGDKRLVAYVVSSNESGNQQTGQIELRNFLKEKLPEYMMPSAFVILEALPLTPNGKVDRQRLLASETVTPELESTYVEPQNRVEEMLAGIWADALRLKQVSIHDNFFELGGDSILAIQIVARANQAGLKLTTKQLFQYQTIAQLATVAVVKQTIQAEQELVTGSVFLTPIQHWFFEQNLHDPHHWNQTFVLEMQQAIDLDWLEQALQQLLLHHDALRLQFERSEFGWQQVIASHDAVVPLTGFDFSALAKTEQELAFKAAATELQTSFNLSVAPLVRVAFFNFGVGQPSRLLLIIHHLAIDTFSWRILLEDLQTAYQQLSQGRQVQLSAKTTSLKYWSEHLQDYAQSVALQSEWDYWLTEFRKQVSPLPVDFPNGDNTVASERNVSVNLSEEQTQALLQDVPQAYNTQINDVLLTALVQAFSQWTGDRSLLVALESHGREEIFDDLELSRTVGWFTSIFPVLLDLGKHSYPGEALKTVKEQLRSIPNRGIGYGILRYLSKNADRVEQLRSLPQPEVVFNYLGQFDQTFSQSSLFKFVPNSSGLANSPQNKRSALLEINGLVVNNQLQFDLTYSEKIHRQSTIERLAQDFIKALQALISHCQSSEVRSYTPSDFPEVNLNQKDLDQFLAKINRPRK